MSVPALSGPRQRMFHTRLGAVLAVAMLLLLVIAQTAIAGGPPVVQTTGASAAPGGAEKVNAFVNPQGAATTFHFDYGTTTLYGHSSVAGAAGSGTSFQSEQSTLSGLTPGSTYHYRISATNASGTTPGNDATFIAGQPLASTLAPTSIIGHGATLNATVNPEGSSTSYQFDYGTSTAYGSSTTAGAAGSGSADVLESVSVSGLTPGTTYHYQVEATNVAGTVRGIDQTFIPGRAQATTGAASAVTTTGATLNGSANPAGLDTTYHFEYGTSTSYGTSTPAGDAGAGVAPVAVAAAVSTLTTGATYHYRLVAVNAGGTVLGSDQTFTPGQAQAFTLAASAVGVSGASLNATVNPGGQATTYHFEYGTSTGYGTTTGDQSAGTGSSDVAASVPVGALASGTTYHFQVVANNASGPVFGGDQVLTTLPAGPQAPSVSSMPAASVHDTTATLNGLVNPNGQTTTYQFEYGPDESYGATTPVQPAGAGSSPGSVSAAITGLETGTTYHFIVLATNASGTTQGTDQTLTTTGPPPPPTVTGALATGVSDTAATLNGAVNPHGGDTSYHFEWGTDTSYSGTPTPSQSAGTAVTAESVSAPIAGLTPGTTYHFRLVATNAAGTRNGPDGTFTTPVPPSATTAAASGVGDTGADLQGSVNPNGFGTTYYFEYGTDTGYGTTTPSQDAGSGTTSVPATAALTGLSPATTFHYRVVATNGGDVVRGADQTFTTTGTALPPTVGGASTTSVTATTADLTAGLNDNGQHTTYQFEYGTDASYGSVTPVQDAGASDTVQQVSASLAGLAPGVVYHFAVVASSPAGPPSVSADATFTTSVPPTATTTAASVVADNSATLNGSVNPQGSDVSYSFEYGPDTNYGTSTAPVDAGSGTAAVSASTPVTGLSPGTTFHFRVVASNGSDTILGGDQTFTTPVPPSASTTPGATAIGETTATVHGSVNPNGFATQYFFEYGADINYGSQTSAQPAGSGTAAVPVSASLSGLTPGTLVHFRVVAKDGSDVIPGGDQTFTTPQRPSVTTSPATAVDDHSATLGGSVNPNGQATTYQLQYGLDTSYGTTLPAPTTPPTPAPSAGSGTAGVSESLAVTGLTPGTTYHFRLVASNPTGTTNGPDASFTTPIPPSATTGAASGLSATAATLNATVDPNGVATTYRFRYGTDTNYSGTPTSSQNVGSGTVDRPVSAPISGLAPGTTYHFEVVATNGTDAVNGGDRTFATPPAPTVSTGAASSVTTNSATLSGSVDPNGQDATYRFEYGTDQSYGTSPPVQDAGAGTSAVTASVAASGLAASTTYHYRLVATNASGATSGADQTFTTADVPPAAAPPAGGQPGGAAPGGTAPAPPVAGGPAPSAPGGSGSSTVATAPTVSFGGPASEKLAGGTVSVLTGIKVTCPAAGPCSVSVLATGLSRPSGRRGKSTKATLASARPSVASGASLSITLKLGAGTLKRLLKGRSTLPMTITLVARGRDGKAHNYTRTITVRTPKKGTIRLKG